MSKHIETKSVNTLRLRGDIGDVFEHRFAVGEVDFDAARAKRVLDSPSTKAAMAINRLLLHLDYVELAAPRLYTRERAATKVRNIECDGARIYEFALELLVQLRWRFPILAASPLPMRDSTLRSSLARLQDSLFHATHHDALEMSDRRVFNALIQRINDCADVQSDTHTHARPGGRVRTDLKLDQRVWSLRQERKLKPGEIAKALGLKLLEVTKSLDRQRHRHRRFR